MKTDIAVTLLTALIAANEHLDWIGYGDSWERECARADGLEDTIARAIAAAEAAGILPVVQA